MFLERNMGSRGVLLCSIEPGVEVEVTIADV